MDTKVTDDGTVTEGTGNENKMDMQVTDRKETGDAETVGKEVKQGIETEVTKRMATVNVTEMQQRTEEESTDNSDMEPLTKMMILKNDHS